MTQTRLKDLTFYSCSSISAWAGKENGIKYMDEIKAMPYVEKDGRFYYFGFQVNADGVEGFHLLMTAFQDIGD